jgi:hypothetical protein
MTGTARNPCFKKSPNARVVQAYAQRALNAKNGQNRDERDERATLAELHHSKTLRKGRKHSRRRLESNAGITSQWHFKLN